MPAGHLQERVRSRTHFSYQERGALASQVELPAPLFACLLDLGGALALVLRLLLVPEALLACGGAVTSVLLYDLLAPELALNLNWLAVTIVLVFPITNGISSAFQRREHAILALAEVRSLLVNIYSAHLCWDWPAGNTKGWHGRGEGPFAVEGLDGQNRAPGSGLKANGQKCLSEEHAGHIRLLLHAIIDSIQELLLVPRRGRIRHHHTSAGKEEMQQVVSAELQGRESVMRLLGRLHHATEALKAAGLPANEASRINSWTFSLTAAFERCGRIKPIERRQRCVRLSWSSHSCCRQSTDRTTCILSRRVLGRGGRRLCSPACLLVWFPASSPCSRYLPVMLASALAHTHNTHASTRPRPPNVFVCWRAPAARYPFACNLSSGYGYRLQQPAYY